MDSQRLALFFSQKRLNSYNNTNEHFENLRLIAAITPRLASIELILRNLLDFEMRKIDVEWLRNYKNDEISSKISKLEINGALTHNQLLSKMSLGEIVKIINGSNMCGRIFALQHFDFRKYEPSNKNFCKDSPKKRNFTNGDKAEIFMSLLIGIRNRCFHWENLLKTRINKDKAYPRITTKFRGTMVGVLPQNIKIFLDDVLKSFDSELLKLIDEV